jgi:hypothetical protein
MPSSQIELAFTTQAQRRVVQTAGDAFDAVSPLVAAAPELKQAENLGLYCGAVNFLARGRDYRLILDPKSFKDRYESRYKAEDPKVPFQEGVARLRDFGHSNLEEVMAPQLRGKSVVFYVEDDYLGIPYRVTAPGPSNPEGDVTYEPVPVSPAPG